MIFGQKQQIATKHSHSYGAKQAVEFWTKMAILGQRITGEEA
jgi:hypothetical protein